MPFKLTSTFKPTGDQPDAIRQLAEGVEQGEKFQTLLGVTGSGKTFTIANVIEKVQKPTLVLSHNKTLVAQLYGEFKQFFPDNAVEYFTSYYDYYQPEAYLPVSDMYIEKDLSVNSEVEKLRLHTTTELLSGRRDILVLASVSCIYGIGNPAEFRNNILRLSKGMIVSRQGLLYSLVDSLYARAGNELKPAHFRVRGETVEVQVPYADIAYRIRFFGDEIEEMESFNPDDGKKIQEVSDVVIFPANMYLAPKNEFKAIIKTIQQDLDKQVEYFAAQGREIEAKRIHERVTFDVEMMRELGYCSGIENYSRYLDRRREGERPFCLLDYFPDDFLLVIDESHVTIGQLHGMFAGDRSRKQNLVDYGFRLPAALDNRPLRFDEFESMLKQTIFVSATPAEYEIRKSEGVVVEQVVRPTGLLEPMIDVRPSLNQVDNLMEEIRQRTAKGERSLVTTLTKRMAEELSKYLLNLNVKCRYIHSDVETLERIEIIRDLRLGKFDVLIGVNLLREGLDLPEVSLVAILDADKEGFLRSERSLTQIAGRAARNVNGLVVMYADKITDSMRRMMEESVRRRAKQMAWNEANYITPKTILKSREEILGQSAVLNVRALPMAYVETEQLSMVADPVVQIMNRKQLEQTIQQTKRKMKETVKDQDFLRAATLRDEIAALEKMMTEKFDRNVKI